MSAEALGVFERLMAQVEQVEEAALRAERDGYLESAPILRRSAFVLAVASVDTYFHERVVAMLSSRIRRGPDEVTAIVSYLRRGTDQELSGSDGLGHIRLALSYKTLVSPDMIDKALLAGGVDPQAIWLSAALKIGSRPDRIRLQLQLYYDRRNQIAHEGDWDAIQLEFRAMQQAHLEDCTKQLAMIIRAVEDALALAERS
ncbi:hypothetical protein [Frigoribacterium sp. MEB024]|uniref:hypothetical protein n=1 Tax=Frigoribacterium sp. MEB024 TaxID=1589899 RepID=UPI0012E096CE|nr:hypothetical protein [Frigoribacterium sp. MEB024]